MEVFNDADAFIDDLEVVEIIIHRFPRRTYDRANYFDSLEEHDFVRRFRLTKNTVLMVLELIEEEIEFINNRYLLLKANLFNKSTKFDQYT